MNEEKKDIDLAVEKGIFHVLCTLCLRLTFQLHTSFAQIIPEITVASIPPPGKVDALARYKPFIGVLK